MTTTIQGLKEFAGSLRTGAARSAMHRVFSTDTSGNVGMIFAMLIVPTTAFVGMGIDYSRAFNAKAEVQQVVDAATLRAAKEYQRTGNSQESIAKAKTWFTTAMQHGKNSNGQSGALLENVTLDEAFISSSGRVTMSADVSVKTTFLQLANIKTVSAKVRSEASVPVNAKDVEMAVVFDVTGSMNDTIGPMTRLASAKLATHDLIDILMPDAPHNNLVRISLVPFSQVVNVGDYAATVTDQPATKVVDEGRWKWLCPSGGWGGGHLSNSQWENCWTARVRIWRANNVTYYRKNCTAERMQATTGHAYDDALPSTAPFPAFWTSNSNPDALDDTCTPAARLQPLTSNKELLHSQVNTYVKTGGTGGHIGTAWGWYTISPNWESVWPAESKPEPFDNTKRLKAVIIMTDGAFNYNYNSSYTNGGNNADQGNGSSASQALQICEQMKAQGVEVFAVGVGLEGGTSVGEPRHTLMNCVSEPNNLFDTHFYDTLTHLALKSAFQDIATAVSAASGAGAGAVSISK
jgi:Flp pilus assembly protein TadG